MPKYEVTIRTKQDDNRWTMTWPADSFGDAEFKTIDQLVVNDLSWHKHYEIIRIEKDYDAQ